MVYHAKCKSTARLDGKTAVVTGCNTGIGKCTVQDFYKRGARVIMACRNIEKAEEAAADVIQTCKEEENVGKIIVVELNLTSLKSVRECAQKIIEHEEHIELLVNNAGVMLCPEGKTEDGFETHFGTNHLGHFLLTMLLLPKIIKSKPARIVNVSSLLHASSCMNFDDLNWETRPYRAYQAYCQSKLANVIFTKALARKLKEANIEGVTTYALHPGVVATDLGRHVDSTMFRGAHWLQKHFLGPFLKTPELGAQTSVYCAVDENAGNETGLYYAECKVKEASFKANKPEDASLLWKISTKLVGLDEEYNPFGGVTTQERSVPGANSEVSPRHAKHFKLSHI